MGEFAKKWERSREPSFIDKVKGMVKPSSPIKPRLEQAIRHLQSQIAKLETASARLRERDQTIFNRIVQSLSRHDQAHASIYANELVELRKMYKMIISAKLALEQIVLRLQTVSSLGDIAVVVGPAMAVVKGVKGSITKVLPEAEREIGEISTLLNGLLVDAGQVGAQPLSFEVASEEAAKILEEASAVAEQKMKERLPEIPESAPEDLLPEPPS